EQNTNQFRPYMVKMQDAITAVAGADKNSHHPMLRQREVKKSGYIVITSDQGHAGAYNANVLKHLIKDIENKHNSSEEYSILVLDQSGVDFLNNKAYDIHESLREVPDQSSIKEIQAIAKKAIDLYSDEAVDEVKIYYSHFVSVLENTPSMKTVLPLSPEDSSLGHGQMSSYEFEPDKEAILRVILS